MAKQQKKEIRAYRLKNSTYVCPVCASDEEKAEATAEIVAEDIVHDSTPMECVRCKKKVK